MNRIYLMLPLLLFVVITPAVAHATNESSYNLGYKGAFGIFRCIASQTVSNDCDGQGYSFNQYDVCTTSDFKPASSETDDNNKRPRWCERE